MLPFLKAIFDMTWAVARQKCSHPFLRASMEAKFNPGFNFRALLSEEQLNAGLQVTIGF